MRAAQRGPWATSAVGWAELERLQAIQQNYRGSPLAKPAAFDLTSCAGVVHEQGLSATELLSSCQSILGCRALCGLHWREAMDAAVAGTAYNQQVFVVLFAQALIGEVMHIKRDTFAEFSWRTTALTTEPDLWITTLYHQATCS